jgi:Ca2+-binding EF-hand superfamily protein
MTPVVRALRVLLSKQEKLQLNIADALLFVVTNAFMRLFSLLTPLVMASLLAGCATKSNEGRSAGPLSLEEYFELVDRNGDGRVSRQEFIDFMVVESFYWVDRDEDGFISEPEFISAGGSREEFRRIDRNQDGKIAMVEAQKSGLATRMFGQAFDEADTNGDGFVTLAEFRRYRARAMPYTRGTP